LEKSANAIKIIRIKYETDDLSEETRERNKKWQNLQAEDIIASEIEVEINKLKTKNLYKLWNVFKLTTQMPKLKYSKPLKSRQLKISTKEDSQKIKLNQKKFYSSIKHFVKRN
jgi:hypothetical protein